ncbi:hypothetical protein ACFO4N_05755 [Camelliibacillus cellulosilyticus]|uniref:Ketosteroid isomerase-like protein n=1 Tax=Camelliibacillus cellulosilyticus TaxID=2174486 RepID=A0ABV9GIV3_9BACL
MALTAIEGIRYYREQMNKENVADINRLVADDFFAVFSLGKNRNIETYDAEHYRSGNLEVFKLYEGKNPVWDYTDFQLGQRFDDEVIVSSQIDFFLDGHLLMKALCTEVYREESGEWKLARQYMEKFKPM